MPWGVAASVAGSVIAGAMSSGSVSDATSKANAISQATIDEARGNYGTGKANYQPYIDQGTTGLNTYADILGVNGTDAQNAAKSTFTASPGYQYSLEQGLRGVDAGAASKGMLRSGATIKAEQTLGNNLANQDFSNYLTRLSTLAGYGLSGAQGQTNETATYNNLLTGQSSSQQNTLTSGATQQASIYQNTAGNLTNAAGLYNKISNANTGLGTDTSTFGGAGSSSLSFSGF